MKNYNVALVGFGGIGKVHSYAISSIPYYYQDCGFSVTLHTVCGHHPQKTDAAASRYGFLNRTVDFDSVLRDPDIDIVDICTPNSCHFEQARGAILAGKHVYCDKPLAVSAAQCKELARLAEKSSKKCAVTFQNRFWPAVIRAKELIDDGFLGELASFRAVYLHSSLIDKDKPYSWRNSPVSEGGGVLNDLGSHALDLLIYLCGRVESASAITRTLYPVRPDGQGGVREILSDDAAFMTLRLENGACGTLEASKLATGLSDSLRIELHGTQGAIMFDLMRPGELKIFDRRDSAAPYGGLSGFKTVNCLQKYPEPCSFLNGSVLPGWVRAHIHSYFNFLDCIHSSKPVHPSFEEAAYVQQVIESARS